MDLQIIVFLNQSAKSNDMRTFERIIRVPVGVEPPYSSLVSVMKFLFGVGSIVSFQVL